VKYSEYLKALQNRSVPPVMTFLGEETFLKDRAMEALINRFLDDDSRQYNYRSFAGEELKDSSFLEDASTLPMFSEWKIVHIKGASALDKSFAKIKHYLEHYLEAPSPNTLMIFDVDQFEGRSKFKNVLAEKTTVVEFNPLSEKELPSWINSHLKTLNFQIDNAAIEALVDRTGNDLQRIAAELEKLMLLRSAEKRIKEEDVESMVGHSPTATVWQWTEAILDQNSEPAIHYLNDLLENGEEPIKCVAILGKQYEKMILTKEMVQQKIPEATISKKIGKPVYYLKNYLNQLSRYTMQDLVKAVSILSAADKALKTSQAKDEAVLQLMTIQLCSLKLPPKPIFDVPLQ
jgi:DNA polymerase III subunit delta